MQEQVHLYLQQINKTSYMDAMLSTMLYQQRAAPIYRLIAISTVLRWASDRTIDHEISQATRWEST